MEELTKRLLDDVVIFSNKTELKTGAQALEPAHAARQQYRPQALPTAGSLLADDTGLVPLQQEVQQLLSYQAELLDTKNWAAYIDLFSADGVYWMPARPEQTEWADSPSIFAEDRQLMTVRMGRITHPNAWSQAPFWGTSHLVGGVTVEEFSATQISVRSRFQVMELRRDTSRHFAGCYRHILVREGSTLKIKLQRVDLLNAAAPFDYTIQAWV